METIYPLNSTSPHPLPQPLATTFLLSVSNCDYFLHLLEIESGRVYLFHLALMFLRLILARVFFFVKED